jgi:predicted DNA-binding transcriptional regulator AlpA
MEITRMHIETAHHTDTAPRRRGPSRGGSEYVTPREVREITGLSEVTQWRRRRAGSMPPLVTLSPGRKAYRRSVFVAWQEQLERG